MIQPSFKIQRTSSCGINITGLESDQYRESISNAYNGFRYSDVVSVNILTSLDSKEEIINSTYAINDHSTKNDTVQFNLERDGIYKINRIIIPTYEWFEYITNRGWGFYDYSNIFLYVKDSDKIVKLTPELPEDTFIRSSEPKPDNQTTAKDWIGKYWYNPDTKIIKQWCSTGEISNGYGDYGNWENAFGWTKPEEMIFDFQDIDIEELIFSDLSNSTAFIESQYTFTTCHLEECYYRHCNEYFSKLCDQCEDFSEKIKIRDMIWMSINVIKYLLDQESLFEAQRIVEKLIKCSGICYNLKNEVKNVGCGCSE